MPRGHFPSQLLQLGPAQTLLAQRAPVSTPEPRKTRPQANRAECPPPGFQAKANPVVQRLHSRPPTKTTTASSSFSPAGWPVAHGRRVQRPWMRQLSTPCSKGLKLLWVSPST